MRCVVKCVKCCTDRVLGTINCLIAPPSVGLIIAKAYEVPKINDISWGYVVSPLLALTGFNFAYYTCCRFLLDKREGSSKREVELTDM